MSKTHIVWFKRDLRVHDHAPLAAACASGEPVLALYIFEPELWSGPDGSARRLTFLRESLSELADALRERGAELVIRTGDAVEIFSQLHRDHGIKAIHMHRESRSGHEGKRIEAVRRWALRAGVSLREQSSDGLLKPASLRSEWRKRWHGFMTAPRRMAPEFIFSASARSEDIADIELAHLQESDDCPAPPGGRSHGVRLLRRAFVAGDAHTYRDVVRALKQHIGLGTISVREAVQAAMRAERIGSPEESTTYAKTLIDRLRDDCERQYRMEERRTANPFDARLPAAMRAEPEAALRRSASASKKKSRGNLRLVRPEDQLSFDFNGPRRAS